MPDDKIQSPDPVSRREIDRENPLDRLPPREENHSHGEPFEPRGFAAHIPEDPRLRSQFTTQPDRPSLISVQGLADLALRSLADCAPGDVAARRHAIIGIIQIARLRMRDRALDECVIHFRCTPSQHHCAGLCNKIRALIPPDMSPGIVDPPTPGTMRDAMANFRLVLAQIAVLATRASQWTDMDGVDMAVTDLG